MTDVPIEHHPTIRYMVYNGYYKVMSNIPKMGQLPTPVEDHQSEKNESGGSSADHHLLSGPSDRFSQELSGKS